MTTSATTSFEFEVLDFMELGYGIAGLVDQKLGYGHAKRARQLLQSIFGDWQNRHTFPWKLDLESVDLTEGTQSYTLDTATISILDMVFRQTSGDIPMIQIALTDYMAIPNKSDEGQPDRYFLRRDLAAPTLFIWQTADAAAAAGTLEFYRTMQLYDITASSQTLDMAKRWSMAVIKRLGYELMPFITPIEKRDGAYQNERTVLRGEMNEAFDFAVEEDRDTSTTAVYPQGWVTPGLWS